MVEVSPKTKVDEIEGKLENATIENGITTYTKYSDFYTAFINSENGTMYTGVIGGIYFQGFKYTIIDSLGTFNQIMGLVFHKVDNTNYICTEMTIKADKVIVSYIEGSVYNTVNVSVSDSTATVINHITPVISK